MRAIITDYAGRERHGDLSDVLTPEGEGGIESDIRACQRAIGQLAELLVEQGADLSRVAHACGIYSDLRLPSLELNKTVR